MSISTFGLNQSEHAAAAGAAFREMGRIETLMSSHRDDSASGRLNAAPRGAWHPLDGELGALLERGMAVQQASDAAFHMGLRPLVVLWGFSQEPPPSQPPPMEAIAQWRTLADGHLQAAIQLRKTDAGDTEIRLENAAFGLDLGAIAKGYAIDRAMHKLLDLGVSNALINAGGDIRAVGNKGGAPWRIGVRHPRPQQVHPQVPPNPETVVAAVETTTPLSMVTSGDYERFFDYEGRRYHHVLDPHSGAPAAQGWASISVQAANAELADALSTALMNLSHAAGQALLEKFPGAAAMWYRADGERYKSPDFQGEWLI
ncbi:putative ApbE family lipoprotein [Magnetofaba australis IT-1]|uniref:FAD:protein FMN transferase n=1 Tax=Magnetofaba australis IT-1 TaxID=1434232 RepID=A0A1Y2K2U5_9PROT|nr:putative ApbE family lipoprotein [Magnetofaba australis IT-1]